MNAGKGPSRQSPFEAWRDWAIADASERRLPALPALVEGLARGAARLRSADWNDDASRREGGDVETDAGR